jgi:mono/diheme cytochrome c family protein
MPGQHNEQHNEQQPVLNRFWMVVATIATVLIFVEWIIPAVSREITGLPFPLTVPRALMFIYMVLTLIALFLFVTFSDENLEEFWQPIRRFLRGDFGSSIRNAVLVIIPLLMTWYVFDLKRPQLEPPLALRIQHPSSNFPKSYEALNNPFAAPSLSEVEAFIAEAKSGEVNFIEQLDADFEVWRDINPDAHILSAINTGPIKSFLIDIEEGDVDIESARQALVEKNLFEGRALYAMNCRACHGDSAFGDGPMADGFKLRPINFTDNGTLETIVEGYTFWRVTNGGPGLPTEATPWDSAMPEWKLSLSEEQRWKIILAEYDLAQKTPRIPEAH